MAEDAVKVAPHAYKVVMENDRVRVLESRMKPGEETEMHSHPALVAVAISDASVKFTLPDGQTIEASLKTGEPMFSPAIDHSTVNTGDKEAHVILVELK